LIDFVASRRFVALLRGSLTRNDRTQRGFTRFLPSSPEQNRPTLGIHRQSTDCRCAVTTKRGSQMSGISTERGRSKGRGQKGAIAALVGGGLGLLSLSFLSITGSASPAPTTITVSQNAAWGPTLTLSNGDALYRLSADSKDHSRCTGQCATFWPPVLLAPGQKVPVGKGVRGLGSFTRANGTHQVTLDGIPLYRFAGDKKPGQVTGNMKNAFGRWWSINPQHPTIAPTKVKTGGTGGSSGTTTTSPPTTTTTTTTPPPTTTTTSGGGIAY